MAPAAKTTTTATATPATAYLCKGEACAIQECLAENGYQQRACLPQIRALVRCCEAAAAARRRGGGGGGKIGGGKAGTTTTPPDEEAAPVSCGGFSAELLRELERPRGTKG
jgi:hypothetical protein